MIGAIARFTIAVALAFSVTPSQAQQPPTIDTLRLFTTPAERGRLEMLRRRAYAPSSKGKPVANTAVPPSPIGRVEVRGVILRSDGRSAVWVNEGSTLRGESMDDGLRVLARDDGAALVRLANRVSIVLRPGQSYDPRSGETVGIDVGAGR